MSMHSDTAVFGAAGWELLTIQLQKIILGLMVLMCLLISMNIVWCLKKETAFIILFLDQINGYNMRKHRLWLITLCVNCV